MSNELKACKRYNMTTEKIKDERNYDSLLITCQAAMLEKLKENEHKDGFDNINLIHGVARLFDEADELDNELKKAVRTGNDINIPAVRREAADVANFAAMIIYKCDQILKEEKGE